MTGYMYILACADGSTYVGSTRSLEKRVWEHNNGFGAAYTKHRLPVTLAYFEEYADIGSAFGREKQVQGWGRVKRRALIEGRYDDLPAAARRRSRPDP
ncbi:GIY-YIG nuclease family protein [Epidermidibacterium keratini]|uniref:GIY-YIG nuclease family protein n=1 Tax=Epidermidibacterium keratini TaxID=1891644 RepID=A0A7L4YPJ1_9ACTN|nr:GIY-YIG nuclease family protein [Epidermidibacterium keratini]QHC00804.1 GIY-YIG nuclease family protein [Epidermidibacterium keratini]